TRVLWAIIRKTWGWGKKTDWISGPQFEGLTRIDRRNIKRTLKILELRKLIVVHRDDKKTIRYGFQKDYTRWKSPLNSRKELKTRTKKRVKSKSSEFLSSQGIQGGVPMDDNLSSQGTHTKEKRNYNKRKPNGELRSRSLSKKAHPQGKDPSPKCELTDEQKQFFLMVEKTFPEVWKFTQREANNGTPLEDVVYALKEFLKCGEVENHWAYLTEILKKRKRDREQERIRQREQEWETRKIQEAEDVKRWINETSR
ncbi:MAG: replication protein, partial [Thermodesulfobacteriota bacterium]